MDAPANPIPGRWTLVWPGLPRLWLAGHWRGLAVALTFATLLNGALLATFTHNWDLGLAGKTTLWAAVVGFWFVSARNSLTWAQQLKALPKQEECDSRFVAAQVAYLRGHWPEAVGMLRQLLEVRPGDIEARLLLATILRRMERPQEAKEELEDLAKREGAERWGLEYRREWAALKRTAATESSS
jgi:tetratricopeptide (TPR) repeat protein